MYSWRVVFALLAAIVAAALLLVIAVLTAVLPVDALWLSGAIAYAVGLLLGLPAGALYNLYLYRCLARRGGVPKDFVWRPVSHHGRLALDERRAMLPVFGVCAFGFALTMLGGTLCMLGLLRV
jgi:hypothetical protein